MLSSTPPPLSCCASTPPTPAFSYTSLRFSHFGRLDELAGRLADCICLFERRMDRLHGCLRNPRALPVAHVVHLFIRPSYVLPVFHPVLLLVVLFFVSFSSRPCCLRHMLFSSVTCQNSPRCREKKTPVPPHLPPPPPRLCCCSFKPPVTRPIGRCQEFSGVLIVS